MKKVFLSKYAENKKKQEMYYEKINSIGNFADNVIIVCGV